MFINCNKIKDHPVFKICDYHFYDYMDTLVTFEFGFDLIPGEIQCCVEYRPSSSMQTLTELNATCIIGLILSNMFDGLELIDNETTKSM